MILPGKYGYFDPPAREYVVTKPDTPTPWINYIGGGDYGGIVSNTGGGYSFAGDPRYKRVLRYRYNSIPEDQPGRYVYIRDDEDGSFWSATWQPVKSDYESYECRIGLGYTRISFRRFGIQSDITYFVPVDSNFELWHLTLKNTGTRTRSISLFTYAEFCFFDAVKDQQNVDWVQQIQEGSFADGFIFWNAFMKTWDYIFMGASEQPHSFDTSREVFVGRYRDLSAPASVVQGHCTNSLAHRGNGVGALCHKVRLAPGEEKEIVYALGTCLSPEKVVEIRPFLNPERARQESARLSEHWSRYLAVFQAKTPDEDLNLMLNTWNPYQCRITFNWSRFVSLYQLGINRGMGLRDSAQDILGIVHAIPDSAKVLLTKLLRCQFREGHAYHLFYPLTGEGSMGEAEGAFHNFYSDDHLWLIEAAVAYLKETGNLGFLDTVVEYAEGEGEGTVWEHLVRAVQFTADHLGEHRLPHIGFADWNDTLNLDQGAGRAESVWTAMFYCRVLKLMSDLAARTGRDPSSAYFDGLYERIKSAINSHGWDGEWYLRAFDDNGALIGSRTRQQGKIFLNPQSWAVLSGVADTKRARRAIDKACEILEMDFGMALLGPPYNGYSQYLGGVSTYPPGAKENGGIFVHANTWFIIAELLMNLNDRAFEHYKRIMPVGKNAIPDCYEIEPYVYCQNILAKPHPQYGLGRNSWLTGTASWAYVAATQYLLGIRPDYDALIVDPRVPSQWEGFEVQRSFRGSELFIRALRGEKAVYLDGQLMPDGRIPASLLGRGRRHQVEAYF